MFYTTDKTGKYRGTIGPKGNRRGPKVIVNGATEEIHNVESTMGAKETSGADKVFAADMLDIDGMLDINDILEWYDAA